MTDEDTMTRPRLSLIGTAMLLGCSGAADGTGTTTPSNRSSIRGTSSSHAVIVRVEDAAVCGGPCEWNEDVPWSPATRALAQRAHDALFEEFVAVATAGGETGSTCAPNLAMRLREAPDTVIYVNSDVSEALAAGSGFTYRRVTTEVEYQRRPHSRDAQVAYLEIKIYPVTWADDGGQAGRSAVGYICDNRTAADGDQLRDGTVVDRGPDTLYVTLDGGWDE